MGQAKINIQMGVVFNKDKFNAELAQLSASVKSRPPVEFKTNMGKVDTGNAQSIIDSIQKEANVIDSIIVKQRTLRNESGQTYTAITSMAVKARDANGNLAQKIYQVENGIKNLDKTYKVVEKDTVTMNMGKQVAETAKAYEQKLKSFGTMSKLGEDYAVRSEKWSAKEREEIQKTNTALQSKIATYKKLLEAGKFTKLENAEKEIQALNAQMNRLISSSKYGAGVIRGWSDSIRDAVKQTISYTFSLGGLRAAQMLVNQGIQYAIDLNKEMVKIQVLQAEGARSPEEINALANSYNDLAKDMGTTTLEVAKGSVEWLRQGKSIQETQELLKSSTMLSKLGALEAADATEYLTSTLNSYGMEASEALGIVDKLVAVDNKSATSTKELATALRYSAASAKDAGVSLEELISYIGVVSSTTRQNAESIGQGMKTMFARMQDIKAGAIDEDGLGLNNVEIALKRVDIPLRDTKDSFRDMGGVLEDLAGKWDTLTEVEQNNIAKAVAGVRQQNMFRVLMANMGNALKLQEEQYNSTGLASDRYGIYLDGVEAAQNRVKASTEALFQQSISSGFITSMLNSVSSVLNLIESLGGLNAILAVTVVLFASLKFGAFTTYVSTAISTINLLRIHVISLNTALKLLNLTLLASPYFWVAAAIIGVGATLYHVTQEAERNKKAFDDLADSAQTASEQFAKATNTKESFNELWNEMEELRKKTSLTADETERLSQIYNELNTIAPGLIEGEYDENLNYIISENASREETIALLTEEIALRKQVALETAKETAIAGDAVAKGNADKKAEIERILAEYAKMGDSEQKTQDVAMFSKQLKEIELAEKQHALLVLDTYKKLQTAEERMQFKRVITNKDALDAIRDYNLSRSVDSQSNRSSKYMHEKETIESNPTKIKIELDEKEFSNTIENLREKIEDMQSLFHKANVGEFLSEKDLTTLRDAGVAFEVTAEGIRIAESEYKKYIDTQAIAIEDIYELTEAQSAVVDSIQEGFGYFEQSQSAYTATYEGLSSSLWDYASNTGFAFQTMEGQAITSADGIFSALSQSSASFQNIVSQMAIQTGQTTIEVMAQIFNYAKGMTSSLLGLAPTPVAPFSAPSGGGGGGGGKSAEQIRLEKEIDRLEKKKKAIQDMLDDFKDYIKAQKELLKLEKEEAEFQDELLHKEKDLAKLKSQITLLALDDSEEARAQRLKLEEDAANLEEEINEDKEDRIYEVKINALDKAQADYEAKIEAQIEQIDAKISKYQDEEKAIKSTGGAVGGVTQAVQSLGTMTQQVGAIMAEELTKQFNLSERNKESLQREIDKWVEKKGRIQDAEIALYNYANLLAEVQAISLAASQMTSSSQISSIFYGGQKHEGGFAGDVKSNEVFHKLLKGEYVATEGQMANFVKNILPTMMSQPMVASTNKEMGDITISMPINVAGNLDKSVVPQIEEIANQVISKLNGAMQSRGFNRRADLFGGI